MLEIGLSQGHKKDSDMDSSDEEDVAHPVLVKTASSRGERRKKDLDSSEVVKATRRTRRIWIRIRERKSMSLIQYLTSEVEDPISQLQTFTLEGSPLSDLARCSTFCL